MGKDIDKGGYTMNEVKKVEYDFSDNFSEESKNNFLKFLEELKETDHNCSVVSHTNHSNHNNW